MGMPLHIIITGIPMAIMELIASQESFISSMEPASTGITRQIIPSLPISHVIRAIIGMRMGIIMGIIPPMPIIGIMGIIPPIIGIIPPPIICIGFMPIMGITPFIIGFIIPGCIGMGV